MLVNVMAALQELLTNIQLQATSGGAMTEAQAGKSDALPDALPAMEANCQKRDCLFSGVALLGFDE